MQLEPGDVNTERACALALQHQARLDESEIWYRRVLEKNPAQADVIDHLGDVLLGQGIVEEAIATKRRATALDAKYRQYLLLALHYDPALTAADIFAEHRAWSQREAEPLKGLIQPHVNDPSPGRRLRVGYVSPDFREHSVSYFIEPVLEHHDRAGFEVVCYSNSKVADAVTDRLRGHVEGWQEVADDSDEELAQRIRRDRIDILVDLAGHTVNPRVLAFARKPAPVQVNYCGYVNSSGLSVMDYWITDCHLDPPGEAEAPSSEERVRLPETFVCYRAPGGSPEVGPLPAESAGQVTFASFNAAAKLNARVIEAYAKVLLAVPKSRLILKFRAFDSGRARQHLRDGFARHGVRFEERVVVEGFEAAETHLASYLCVDIALDPFPFNGHTTSLHAMWMGVPVVTLAGHSHVSRRGVSVMRNMELPELIAGTVEEYVSLAATLAGDLPRLRALRSTLRPRLRESPLMNAPRYMRHLEAEYRRMWRRWCEKI
jgi:predicted O-linked N-acetylglucosamine transferase (SPINDLY family)